jgi:hypothetical protein
VAEQQHILKGAEWPQHIMSTDSAVKEIPLFRAAASAMTTDVVCHAMQSCRIVQVKVAEHILTGHKVAIKILNRRKISAMDMEEKGAQHHML